MTSSLFPLLRPLLHAFDAEDAHQMTINALALLPNGQPPADDPRLHHQRRTIRPCRLGIVVRRGRALRQRDAALAMELLEDHISSARSRVMNAPLEQVRSEWTTPDTSRRNV